MGNRGAHFVAGDRFAAAADQVSSEERLTGPGLGHARLAGANMGVSRMPVRLTEAIKREVELDGQLYTLTIGPKGVHIAPKGKRKGHELSWRDLASGDAELNQNLVRSLTKQVRRSGG